MSQTMLERAYQLARQGESFVMATVVWCERPTSAKPGAQAIIQGSGQITGWIGGSCAQPVVIREALKLLREGGDPYLLRLGSSESSLERKDMRIFPMTCTSGGVLDIYLEPHLPQPQLVLVGDSPVNKALHQLASALDFAIFEPDSPDLEGIVMNERTAILVATHGEYDEDVLEMALAGPAFYVGMVGSLRRAEECRESLRLRGLAEQQITRLKSPAGLDIGAQTPEEIAASILAELVQVRRQKTHGAAESQAKEQSGTVVHELVAEPGTALDPVCGMIVAVEDARHHMTYDGREFYFCCPACKRAFESDPQRYLIQAM